jgi:hypothetical protein
MTPVAPHVEAQVEIAPPTKFFGAAAVALGQTARVSVSSFDDPNEFQGVTCNVGIQIRGVDGSLLATTGNPALPIGQTFFVDVPRSSLKVPGNRALIRAVVGSVSVPNITPNPCLDIRATVEVYDNLSGRTQVFIGDPNQDTEPVNKKSFGAAAVAFGQTIRVNVSSFDDPEQFPAGATCTIGVNIVAADGRSLLTATDSAPLQLPVGQTLLIDLNRNTLNVSGNRVLFRAVVNSVSDPEQIPNPCADIRATVEVYDNLTGRTQVFIGDPHIFD